MKKIIKDVLIIAACIIALVVVVKLTSGDENYAKKYEGYNLTDVGDVGRKNTYRSYLSKYANKGYPAQDVPVNIFAYDEESSTGTSVWNNYKGESKVLYTEDASSVTWKVDVPEAGLYNILLDYIATPSRNIDIERSIYINGELPFDGADTLVFLRLWHDGAEVTYDNQKNMIRPSQKEIFDWQKSYCKNDLGYIIEPYCFYFHEGENTITMNAENEPFALRSVILKAVKPAKDYKAYKASLPASTAADDTPVIKIQGEDSTVRSDPSLFAKADRASPYTEPHNVQRITLNYIGGDSWKTAGQWIQWDFEVPSDGYYKIAVKGRQMYQRGSISCRTVYIDGEVPFAELNSVGFNFSNEWNNVILADKDNTPYEFYLKKGKHNIRLEVTLGEISSLINDVEDSIFRLNQIYRTILVLTGANPDKNRDYNLEQVYPETIEAMNIESKRLYKIVDGFTSYAGQMPDTIAPAQTLAAQLEEFYKKPYKITQAFSTYKENITALGNALLTLTQSKLDVDVIYVAGRNTKIPTVKKNMFKSIGHSVSSFSSSYTNDSTNLGNVYSKKDKDLITVWIASARDQSTVLKNIIDESFTPKTGIKVNLKLINIDTLLSAVVAGTGPNVVLSIDSTKPVDYALRNANENLRQFADCDEVLNNFYPSAYRRYQFNGGLYALPETETFSLLFYRKDILAQLGLEIPETWDDLIAMLPTLQGNKLDVGIQCPSVTVPSMGVFFTLLYQNDGVVYNNSASRCILDTEEGIRAFKQYTSFYVNYGLPVEFDFVSRFRTGEMPVAIADYASYNQLAVAAPEIRGLWDFTLIPGTVKTNADGSAYIDRTNNADGLNCMMIKTKDEHIRQNAWEFMKWWVSEDTQLRFGRDLESILGASGRYATANKNSLKQLSWSTKQLKVLTDTLDDSFGVPEVPGSYYTNRNVTNAIRKVINVHDEPREVLIDYTRKINEELDRKREEFNLPTYKEELKNGGSK